MPQAPLMSAAVEPGRYRHFKGPEYEVLSVGRHTETDELVVVYASVDDPHTIWVRPLSMFLDEVEVNETRLPRFAVAARPTADRGLVRLASSLAALAVSRLVRRHHVRQRMHSAPR